MPRSPKGGGAGCEKVLVKGGVSHFEIGGYIAKNEKRWEYLRSEIWYSRF